MEQQRQERAGQAEQRSNSALLAGMSTDTNEPNWLDYVTAISAVATPLLVLDLSALARRLRHVFERRVALEDKPREDRIAVDNAILEPFIILFSSDEAGRADPRAVLASL